MVLLEHWVQVAVQEFPPLLLAKEETSMKIYCIGSGTYLEGNRSEEFCEFSPATMLYKIYKHSATNN